MALVASASSAADLDTAHTVRVVFDIGEVLFVERCVKGRPAGAGVELLFRVEQRQPAQSAGVYAFQFIV